MKKIAIIAAAIAATVGTPALAQDDGSDHAEKVISQINEQIENTNSIDSATGRAEKIRQHVKAAAAAGARQHELSEEAKKKILNHINETRKPNHIVPASMPLLDGASKLRDTFQPKCCVKCPATIRNGKIPVPVITKFKCVDDKERRTRFPRLASILNKI